MNSKIEELREPRQPSLLNMPKVVMGEVLKNLDGPSIFSLRKVCRDLRFSIDKINPELHFDSVKFELPLTTSSMESYTEKMDEDIKKYHMEHHTPSTGCSLEWKQGNVYKDPEISMEDAGILLKNPRLILKNLTIDLLFLINSSSEYIEKKEEDLKKFYEHMKSLLGNRDQLLKTKEIQLDVFQLSQAADFLKCTDPESLKTISILCHPREVIEMDFSEFEVLEQWKNAKELNITGDVILNSVDSFETFETISIHCIKISIEKLNEVKELFARSSKLQKFSIVSDDIRRMEDQIISNFGQFDSHEEEYDRTNVYDDDMFEIGTQYLRLSTWTWMKEIPGFIEKLQIILDINYGSSIDFCKV